MILKGQIKINVVCLINKQIMQSYDHSLYEIQILYVIYGYSVNLMTFDESDEVYIIKVIRNT